ncbi:hypothetical protein GQ457_11G022260 [Hibiscus cannabinus]
MTTKSPYAIATESFLPTGRPSDGMDKMEVEANPHGVGDALALVDVVNWESIPKPSFRDIVGGGIVADQRNNIVDSLDVSLTEEDVRVTHTGVYPEIRFSERVHQEIDAKLSKSVIVRLLGKSIGYRALKNRVNALWSSIEALNIIDLNNDYYLIRFAMDADYDKVLSGGPWMIYGCYLTVQPWSREFYTAASYPKQILAWLRLLGLPYRYYSKSLFKVIASLLGEVIRNDFNTDDGRRGRFTHLVVVVNLDRPLILRIVIDGSFQAIDYEGLTVICFGCAKYSHSKEVCGQTEVVTVPPAPGHKSEPPVDGRFGPWMQVTNRKHRPDIASQGMNNEGPSVVLKGGSRFKALDLLGEGNQRNASGMEQDSGREPNTQGMGATVRVSSVVGEAEGSAQAVVEGLMHSTGRLREVVLVNPMMVDEGCGGSGDGHADKHSVLRIIEEGNSRVLKENNGRPMYGPIRSNYAKGVKRSSVASKALPQKDVRSKKKNELGSEQLVVADWVSKFASSLNIGIMAAISSVVNDVNNVVVGDANYEPRDENVSIEAEPLLTSSHVPDVQAIMEPRVSGLNADNFIRRAGFDYSYRVEANGFSGGIWVMWKNIVNIDVVAVDNQFIHGSCFVVASQQRHGGSIRRSGVCPRFCDFLFQYGLLDIGFYGPRFTWQRGDLGQWLDRCLCNGKWCEKFALSDVAHLPRLRSDHSPLLLTTTPVVHNGGRRPFRFLSI